MKYELTDEIILYGHHTLHRIKRLSDGKLGGWIESEDNLNQDGNCWIDDNAKVYSNARVSENAKVYNNAIVQDDSYIYGEAEVYEDARILGKSTICHNAKVHGFSWICNVTISDDSDMSGNSRVYSNYVIH